MFCAFKCHLLYIALNRSEEKTSDCVTNVQNPPHMVATNSATLANKASPSLEYSRKGCEQADNTTPDW